MSNLKSELELLACAFCECSNRTFSGDIVASVLDDLVAGIPAEEIVADLELNVFTDDDEYL